MTLTATRHRRILDMVETDQQALVSDLARVLDVSEMTIRRDLTLLEGAGKLRRVHGGAVSQPIMQASPLEERIGTNRAAKYEIAKIAASLVEEGNRIFIGAGSTAVLLAEALSSGPTCNLLTSTPRIADAMSVVEDSEIELTGGQYRSTFQSLYGEDMLSALRNRVFDFSFISAYGLNAEMGVLDRDSHQYHVQRILNRNTRRYVILADFSKFDKPANYQTLPWENIDILVTDQAPPAPAVEILALSKTQCLYPGCAELAAN